MFIKNLSKRLLSNFFITGSIKTDLAGILIVNGGENPLEGKWLDICIRKIITHTKWPNYTIYIWNNDRDENSISPWIREISQVKIFQAKPGKILRHIHAIPLQKLYEIAKKDGVKYIVTFDSDAFPIKDNWLTFLIQKLNKGHDLSGIWRDELKEYIDPYIHASCLCTSIDFINKYKLRFDRLDTASDKKIDTLGYFTKIAEQKNGKLFKLERSNINQLHYIMGGIYGNLIYHQGAGSREEGYFWGEEKTDYIRHRNKRIKQALTRLVFQYNEQFINWMQANNDANKRKILFILGMHRSGTSCLTGCLEACGLFLGNVSRSNAHNALGNKELKEINLLHDKILKKNKGSWDNPPNEIQITFQDKNDFQNICSSFPENTIHAIKDPRSLLLIDHWLIVDKEIGLIASYRHPLSVASSLKKRNNICIEKGLSLWEIYNQKLLDLHQKYRFPIIKFDLEDPDLYMDVVAQAAIELGLNPDLERMSEFIRQELCHERKESELIPNSCKKIYDYLESNRFKNSIDTYSFEILKLKKDVTL